ncbi:hypothetical protein BJAS_P0662 [Bathymodiolus japonicus methanotrophic gill symbiont]|uniref:hypothetical protein n=1 Tax=Bathymodiolus japonicus methanotrophic gill symbiont TaxID=113269 RepID=UPI001B54035D|nr:hypothetical protein [Bathymodiolus japonicus methanotrophic gill symbiont]GFO71288.1 hypothetical protein BJAS_P0662 [Bathymodiolus japonicus methanotrophic gill symbiont]
MKKPIKILAATLAAFTAVPVFSDQVEMNKEAITRNSNVIKSNSESIDYLQDVLLDTPSKITKSMTPKICKGSDVIHWGTCPLNLIGTEIDLKVIFQPSQSINPRILTYYTTANVVEPGIDFPSIADLCIEGNGLSLANVAINVGVDLIEIDFSNVSAGQFTSGIENTYLLELKDVIESGKITSATIDRSVTTLGLEDSDVRFVGDKLSINVEGLSFNSTSFVRINLGI